MEFLDAVKHVVSAADGRFVFDVLSALVLCLLADHDLLHLAELEQSLLEHGAFEE